MLRGQRKGTDYTGEIRPLGRICATVIITMHHPHATDEVIDLIASIEIQRQEMESRSGLEQSRNFALSRLQEALAGEQLPENVEALNQAIRRVQALGKRSNPQQQGQSQNSGRQHQAASPGAARRRMRAARAAARTPGGVPGASSAQAG